MPPATGIAITAGPSAFSAGEANPNEKRPKKERFVISPDQQHQRAGDEPRGEAENDRPGGKRDDPGVNRWSAKEPGPPRAMLRVTARPRGPLWSRRGSPISTGSPPRRRRSSKKSLGRDFAYAGDDPPEELRERRLLPAVEFLDRPHEILLGGRRRTAGDGAAPRGQAQPTAPSIPRDRSASPPSRRRTRRATTTETELWSVAVRSASSDTD